MLVTTTEMLRKAKAGNYAIPSPDFFDNNSARAFVQTAEELKQPIILSFAQAHMEMLSVEEAALIGRFYGEKASVPVALHLDHGMTMDVIQKAIDLGFTSVMIDASSESFEENVKRTKEVVAMAHPKGIVVEAEIGHVGQGANYVSAANTDSIYTEVDQAVKFVEQTGVDSLAVSIGTAHGKYKGTPVINFDRLHELRDALSIPLVLHGGSSSGDRNLERCATEGISKINVFTDFVEAALKAVKEGNPSSYFQLLEMGDEAIKQMHRHYYGVFHCDK